MKNNFKNKQVRINVTKSFLPPQAEYEAYLKSIWERAWLTNNGPLVVDLERKIKDYINFPNFAYVNNGTIALQLAMKALELSGDVITTPFSYCATTTSILWENLNPIFVDINATDLNINPDLIEAAITDKTSAILTTHVYGRPSDVEKIEKIALKYNLKVIYDAAHAFGVKFKGQSLITYGDISTCSFHSTKVFHTIEGGSVVCKDSDIQKKIELLRSFGHILDNYYESGINGKNSEFHAAMGLCNLNYIDKIIDYRKNVFTKYDNGLNWDKLTKPETTLEGELEYNYAYYPIILENPEITNKIIEALESEDIFPRRYFYPSLNLLPYLKTEKQSCPISESISLRVLSLPLSHDIEDEVVEKIISIINNTLAS